MSGGIAFVSASAGSGKTHRVVSEVVDAIAAGTLAPEALVATTFSRRAAASLRASLDRRLRDAGAPDAALRLADARIGTVHGVCASLVRSFARELGRPAGARVVEPAAADAALQEVLHEVVTENELLRLDDLAARLPDLDPWRDAASLVSVARACDRGPDALLADLAAGVDALDAALGPAGDGDATLRALDRALGRLPDGLPAAAVTAVRAARARASLPAWGDLARLTSLDLGAAHDDALGPLRRAAADLLRHPALRADLRAAAAVVGGLAARSIEPFAARRRRAGVVDYLDLESLALALLRRPDAREALAGAFGLVVVDEFQDSSPLQVALFVELASLAPRSLWVGDLKQSIYAFRGADPRLVARVAAAVTGGAAPETLGTSWRSRADLVALTSGLFTPPFGAEGIPAAQVALTAAHPGDDALGPCLERWRVPTEASKGAAAVARGVAALLGDDAVRVRDPATGAPRRPRPGDVAVLARRHVRCGAVADALAALDVPCGYERPGLTATWEARLALAVLRLRDDPDDRLAQAEVARMTADRPDDDAWLHAALAGGDALASLPAVAALRAAPPAAGDLVDRWDRAVLAHGVRDRVRRWGDAAQRLANLDALRALAVAHAEARSASCDVATVGTFVLALRSLAARGDDRQARPAGDAVTVTTWHASKGLEWPVVVLLDVDDELDDDALFGARAVTRDGPLDLGDVLATQRVRYWPAPYAGDAAAVLTRAEGAAREAREGAAGEGLRELYVAWTRARDRVCLAAPTGRLTAGLMGLLQRAKVPLTPEPALGVARWLRRPWPVVEREPSGKPIVPREPPTNATVDVPDDAHLPRGPHGLRWTLPSSLAAVGVVRAAEAIGAAHEPAGGDAAALGAMLHGWLAATATGDAGEHLRAYGCGRALDAAALGAMRDALAGWCGRRFPGWSRHAEVPLVRALPDGSVLRGSADLVLVGDAGVAVVDHKSHRGEGCEARAAEHWGQLRAYADALAEALGKPVAGCFIHLPLAGRMVQIGPPGAATESGGTTMTTSHHAKYWAQCLQQQGAQGEVAGISRSIANARVDLNPHQIDAALFALRSPLSKGALLADEVGLGKTIEAGIVLAQKWAERRRRILLIAPATLRKQWQNELAGKFFLDSVIVETKTVNDAKKKGERDPLRRDDAVVIVSYEFAYARSAEVASLHWDLVVCDEAHRLRSVYKGTKKAKAIADAIKEPRKLLLTATPLQNNLLELYGLVSILDDQVFGPQDSFVAQYVKSDDEAERNGALRDRLAAVCHRTLRRQVLEYIRFTRREAITVHFTPTAAEQALYDKVNDYLQREVLVALPTRQRKLITMVLRKLLASSSRAIGATLEKFVGRLRAMRPDAAEVAEALGDYEALGETAEEWGDDEGEGTSPTTQSAFGASDDALPQELTELQGYIRLAASIAEDQKTTSLLSGLETAFASATAKGARRKAVVFTESVKTQEYLVEWLGARGFAGKIAVMNGTNTDATSKSIYEAWKRKHAARWKDVSSGARTADMKAAIVEAFQGDQYEILIATESAAEGVNLQFCSIVVNYDLPWNPQRVEQRIGRCHRYGQQHDVLVVNFINDKNEADQRVHQLLAQKFQLFSGVFGASDEILGTLESGIDIEQAIADIYQRCRTREEIAASFDALQARFDAQVRAAMADTRQKVLDHLDEEVHEKLRVHRDRAKESLAERERWLLDLCRHELGASATFDDAEARFTVADPDGATRRFSLRWPTAEENGEEFLRFDHPFAQELVKRADARPTPPVHLKLAWDARAAALGPYRGHGGWLRVVRLEADSLDRKESTLLVAAVTDGGAVLADDVARKLFALPVTATAPETGAAPAALIAELGRLRDAWRELSASRERQYLDEEELKLDTRIEDIRLGLEAEVKALDKEVTALRKASKTAKTLAEKVDAQKKIRAVSERRDDKQRKLYEALAKHRADHDDYIKRLEAQAAARAERFEEVFTVRWTVA